MRLEQGELLEPAFAEFGERVVLFCHVTTQVEGDPYPNLLSKKGGSGWPYIVAMDHRGDVLAAHRGPRTTAAFAATMELAERNRAELRELTEQANSGDEAAAVALFEKQLELGQLDPVVATPRLAKLEGLSDARRAELDARIVLLEVHSIQTRATNDPETQYAAGKEFARMVREGRIPADQDALYFWYFAAVYAEKAKDADLLQKAAEALGRQSRLPASVSEGFAKKAKELRSKGGGE